MLHPEILPPRRRGAPLGNRNREVHGRYSHDHLTLTRLMQRAPALVDRLHADLAAHAANRARFRAAGLPPEALRCAEIFLAVAAFNILADDLNAAGMFPPPPVWSMAEATARAAVEAAPNAPRRQAPVSGGTTA